MPKLIIKFTINAGWGLPFWLGINIEEYGCPAIGHSGIKFCLELVFIEFMFCVGKRYPEAE